MVCFGKGTGCTLLTHSLEIYPSVMMEYLKEQAYLKHAFVGKQLKLKFDVKQEINNIS
jgi:hypothetical protein